MRAATFQKLQVEQRAELIFVRKASRHPEELGFGRSNRARQLANASGRRLGRLEHIERENET